MLPTHKALLDNHLATSRRRSILGFRLPIYPPPENMTPAKPSKRPVSGVLLLDKPLHLSSNTALQQSRRLYRAEKAGHTGVLDPLATGVLPVCFGEATKFAQYLLDADKANSAKPAPRAMPKATSSPQGAATSA